MAVITISRQFGSGGNEIAKIICKEAGYTLFDKQILVQAAREVGLSDQEVFDYSEDSHKINNLFERLSGRAGTIAQVRVWKENPQGVRTVELIDLDEKQALSLVRKAVETASQMENILIAGRGGQIILRDHPNTLHVRVESSMEQRLERVRGQLKSTGRTFSSSLEERRAAQDLMAANDAASADYLKRIYSVDWSDPQLYHIIVNTGKLSIKLAAEIILETARKLETAR